VTPLSSDIVLATLNATYQHAAFGLRYLYANLKELQARAEIMEFTISQAPRDIVETLLLRRPKILGLSVSIWNTEPTYQVVSLLKKIQPDLIIVLGGPEVSYESEGQPLCERADFVVKGEGEDIFRELCQNYLAKGELPSQKFLKGALPEINSLPSPYPFYTDADIQNRILYVEASRGCPYKCEFCLSSLDTSVRNFPLVSFLNDMESLLQRGARQFKFVDRTFNLNVRISKQILEFFLQRISLGLHLHFEMVPDRFPEELKEIVTKFPKGSLQFEIGVQTWNENVASLISRKQDYKKVEENFRFLREETNVHLHADLIVGLPGETLESFAQGFDKLYSLRPHEIQVGILKRLKGTPIIRHDQEWQMVYQEASPFTVLSTKTLPFNELQRMVRFAKFWDLISNSGNFRASMKEIEALAQARPSPSLFWEFLQLSDFLDTRHPQRHGIALMNLTESVWSYLAQVRQIDGARARAAVLSDYCNEGKRDIPKFLRAVTEELPRKKVRLAALPLRQQRHLSQ
jgi:radical SAM superfamily enzyme YgiQ (UPF0313 family)